MKFEIQFISLVYLLGGIQTIFIMGYLFLKKNRRTLKSLYLSLILAGLFLTLYDYFIFQNNLQRITSPFFLLSYAFQLVYAPASYLLIKEIVFTTKKFPKIELLHFSPALLHLIYGVFSFHIYPKEYKLEFLKSILNQSIASQGEFSSTYQIFNLLIAVQLIIYLFYSYKLVKNYHPPYNVQNSLSIKKVKSLFRSLAVINIVLLISSLNVRYLIYHLGGVDIGLLILISISLYLFYLAYFVVANPEKFETPVIKYQSSILDTSIKSDIIERLHTFMQEHEPFRNEKLTIKELSDQVNIPARQLSQVVNETYGYSFYDMVNYYRIKEAQNLLADEKNMNLSISGIAYEVGFNSRSSFYTAFKKFTGMTPSNFQKSSWESKN